MQYYRIDYTARKVCAVQSDAIVRIEGTLCAYSYESSNGPTTDDVLEMLQYMPVDTVKIECMGFDLSRSTLSFQRITTSEWHRC